MLQIAAPFSSLHLFGVFPSNVLDVWVNSLSFDLILKDDILC